MYKWVRITVHTACLLPLIWLISVIYFGDIGAVFGADPATEIIHFLGRVALYIFASLFLLRIITQIFSETYLCLLHRPLGIWGLIWATLHILSYLALQLGFDYNLFLSEVVKRPYLILGMIAYLIIISVSFSSIPLIRNRYYKLWSNIHTLSNIAIVLIFIHYYWSVKGIELSPIFFLALGMVFIGWKLLGKKLLRYYLSY